MSIFYSNSVQLASSLLSGFSITTKNLIWRPNINTEIANREYENVDLQLFGVTHTRLKRKDGIIAFDLHQQLCTNIGNSL